MNGPSERRRRADRVFDHALDLEGEARDRFVARECADDTELEHLVRRLLAAAAAGPDRRLATGGAHAGPLAAELARAGAAPDLVGSTVGSYRIMGELGRGGMAVVYLAERSGEDYTQWVALKVLQAGLPTAGMLQRFRLERQILAQVNHPGIAALLDAGRTDRGDPYLVMEYVDGLPIDRWCDERRLTTEERLRLFLKVARVVAHAHRNLVVHRDIKPSNILVTADGEVKLLDFGIAKLLDPDGDPTHSLPGAMTPSYASPEQIEGQPVTTATDVYQLGMLLYVLLTGRWPFRAPDRRGEGGLALLKVICESAPVKASEVVGERGLHHALPGRDPQASAELEGTRRVTVARLRRELGGDLDTILLMALRKEPERRYPSVDRFAADIERHLDGRTVSARPDTPVYRARKFLRRNAAAAVLGASAVVAVAALTTHYTHRLARERDLGRVEVAKATAMADFLRELFAVSAPTRARGEAVTARQLLDRGAARLAGDLADQPELQAMLGGVIGEVYGELALYEEARDLLDRTVALRRERPGRDGLDLAAALHALGRVCERTRDLETARGALGEALALRAAALGEAHALTAETREWLGVIAFRESRYDEARALLESALQDLEAAHGPESLAVGKCLNHLAIVVRDQRDYHGAVALFDRGLAILDAHLDPDDALPAAMRVNYAAAVRFAGDAERADRLLREALPRMERTYGADHPYISVVLTNHGNLLRAMGKLDAAEGMHTRALELVERNLGPDHVQVSWCCNNLGLVARDRGDHAGAASWFERSIALVDRTLGPGDPENAVALINLAQEYRALGRLAAAEPLYRRALAMHEQTYGPQHSYLARPLLGLGETALELGRPTEAEAWLRRALAVGRADGDFALGERVLPQVALARAVCRQGRRDEARALLAEAEAWGGDNDEAAAAVAAARSALDL